MIIFILFLILMAILFPDFMLLLVFWTFVLCVIAVCLFVVAGILIGIFA